MYETFVFATDLSDFAGIISEQVSERFAHISGENLIEIDLTGEISHSKMYLR